MRSCNVCCISFSGLTVRFRFPEPVELGDELSSFLCEDPGCVDAEYEIILIDQPMSLPGVPVHTHNGTEIYHTDKGWLRVYSSLRATNGAQVACLLCPDGNNRLYYPVSVWALLSSPFSCATLMGVESILLAADAFLLHSSVVMIHGKAVLFSGPSGAGKSTQAALWAKHMDAQILNGDRCCVRKLDDGFYGAGSPWAGTSGIYRREFAPIAGIFLVEQGSENRVRRTGADGFMKLFAQTLVNSWDAPFMERITALFEELFSSVPVYALSCRADREAVDFAYHTLF